MDVGNKKNRLPNPRAKANIFEILTFSWILNLFRIGQKRELEIDDLYEVLNDHKSSTLGTELEREWTTELSNARKTNRNPSLLRVLIRIFGSSLLLHGSIQLFVEVVLRVSQPILIGKLLEYFNRDGSNTTDLKQAYIYATCLLLTMLANIMLFHITSLELTHSGMKVRIACCSAIFNKALRLSKSSLGETSVGQVINLLSNDVNRFELALRFIQFLLIGPLGTVAVTYFLWQEIGPSSLVGVVGILVFIPIQGWFGKKTSQFRTKTAPRTDERVRLMNEIISGIQVIKMYTWEKPFASLVQYARKMEIKELRGASCISVLVSSLKIFHIRFAMFISILSYILLGNYINTHKVFVIISLYNILMSTMTVFFPQAILFSAEMLVSIKRVQNFLLQDEKEIVLSLKFENNSTKDVQMTKLENENGRMNISDNQKDEEGLIKHDGIVVSNVFAKWIPSQPEYSLNDISLTVRPGRLVAIIGPVGAGKSSLLHAILRELPLSDGNILVRGVISYASQEPWLFNSSVQQNILFGSPMDTERYNEIVQMCALKPDLEQLPYGDKTIVGEKGVSLSGGQRARINLARAVYKKADIYLLDDPLSAVDTHVGKHLFKKCIKGYLKEKTCILVTHQIQYLKSVDNIVLMENAKILAEGSYQELQSSGLDFTKSLGSPEEIASTDDKPRENNEIDIDGSSSLCVLSKQESGGSVSSLIVEGCNLDGIKAEPKEVAETCSTGSVLCGVYLSYMSAGGSAFKIALLILVCILTQLLGTAGDYWISYWVKLEEEVFWKNENKQIESSENGLAQVPVLFWWSMTREVCIMVYIILTVAMIVFVFIRSGLFVSFFMNISKKLHNDMFNAITRATMYFFNTNSSGRILNRFTKDIGIIDETIPVPVLDFVFTSLIVAGVLAVVGIVNIYLMIPTFVITVISYRVVVFYLSTSRSIKRLEGVARSPVYAHSNASLQGLTTIRAFGAEDILSKEFNVHLDLHSSVWYTFIAASEAFGFSLDMIALVYVSIVTYSFLVVGNDIFGGDVGLVLTQIIGLTGALQWGIRQTAELENHMTSVERVLEYTNVSQEAALESSSPDKKPPNEWPNYGGIVFQNLYLRYSPDTPYVLKNLNIRIRPMEKIGIVGRTGAGKSSLIGALFRLALHEGRITVDEIEIHEIGLHELRSKISIIPQEPVLFSTTMRKNLDPFDEYPDHALWNALDEVELKTVVEDLPDGLNSKMSEGGSNFSVGQRQLVCLARAVVRCNKILVLDEATANVDSQTDALIQNTIKNKFQKFTVLTIAHRLNTVMESDKVLVMDAGTMVEFDHPHNLLQNKNGFFYKMVEQTGQDTANLLHNVAAESFKTMQLNVEIPIKLIDEDVENISIDEQ